MSCYASSIGSTKQVDLEELDGCLGKLNSLINVVIVIRACKTLILSVAMGKVVKPFFAIHVLLKECPCFFCSCVCMSMLCYSCKVVKLKVRAYWPCVYA